MAKQEDLFKNVVSHKRVWIYFSIKCEIYDGLSAVYDYAQNGVELKKILENIGGNQWFKCKKKKKILLVLMLQILMHPTTWKKHLVVLMLNDPLIDNKDSKKRYRADVLIEDYTEKLNLKAKKEMKKRVSAF